MHTLSLKPVLMVNNGITGNMSLLSRGVLSLFSELSVSLEHVEALFLLIQERKKVHCCCELFNLGI